MRTWPGWRWLVVWWGVVCGVLAGCGGDEVQSQLRFIHASPDLPAVDVYVEGQGQPLFTHVAYGTTTEERPVSSSSSTLVLQLRPAGSGTEVPPLHGSQPITLGEGAHVTAVAAGLSGASTSEAALRILPVMESFTPPAPGMVRVRLLHASADAPTLDIDTDSDGSAEVRELARFSDSGAAGLELPAVAPLRFALHSEDPRTQAVAFTLPALPEGSEVLVVLSGLLSAAPRLAEGISLLVAGGTAPQARIRPDPVVYLLNASEEAGQLDVFLGADEQAGQVGFGELSSPIAVSPGVETLDVFTASPTRVRPGVPPLLSQSTATLMSGERYLLIASGDPEDAETGRSTFLLRPYAEGFAEDPDQARLRFIHASASAPVLDASPLDESARLPSEAVFDDVAYTEDSPPEGQPVPTLEFTLGVRSAVLATDSPPTRFDITPAPVEGEGLFGVLAGTFRSGDDSQLRLLLVETATTPWSVRVLTPRPGGE
ncbi:DUF4397 domain-containing protein [Archangium sp.]|uniref:DUF4397 domain-containing protein n=1 Tax=Archangium sp. TaxID=1872627 RepID=UPI00389ADFD0